ncbi:MAG TPA: hypothetical protein VIV12_02020 [Streptosporangiaceae bacterium]
MIWYLLLAWGTLLWADVIRQGRSMRVRQVAMAEDLDDWLHELDDAFSFAVPGMLELEDPGAADKHDEFDYGRVHVVLRANSCGRWFAWAYVGGQHVRGPCGPWLHKWESRQGMIALIRHGRLWS